MMNGFKCVVESNFDEQLLYFTSSSLSANDEWIFSISNRTGHYNVFATNLANGCIQQITNNQEGYLRSYVYFDGTPHRGFGKASVSLDYNRNIIYYLQGDNICSADLNGNIKVLAKIPENCVTAFTHVSNDGKYLCVPLTDGRALEYEKAHNNKTDYDIDKRVQDDKLNSYLCVYDTATGQLLKKETVPMCWITHVQFCPTDANIILYNHEWPCFNAGSRRMWIWDGKNHIQVREHSIEHNQDDWVCHEMWANDGKSIIYHGIYKNGSGFLGRVLYPENTINELSFPEKYKAYGHFTLNSNRLLVSDGYYQKDNENPERGEYISVQEVNWNKDILWKPLGLHGSSWASQDEHPHPIFNHKGDKVYFTSDAKGKRCIYEAKLPPQ